MRERVNMNRRGNAQSDVIHESERDPERYTGYATNGKLNIHLKVQGAGCKVHFSTLAPRKVHEVQGAEGCKVGYSFGLCIEK